MLDRKINLSYVLTTFNKFSYLKIVMEDLVKACKEDEEIVVYDGGSTDGTKEYLAELFQEEKIHQFASEKDFGEANGYNKAMLAAKGAIIKIISDDDAYNYQGITHCKTFMLQNPSVHLVAADGYGVNNLLQHNHFLKRNSINDFRSWKQTRRPFIFCGLSLLIKKDALPLLGLWNQNYLIIDFEYTLRASASKANIGWYTGLLYVNIVNQQSNSGRHWQRMEMEKEKLEQLYFGTKPLVSFKTKDKLKNLLRPIKYKLFPKKIINPLPYQKVYSQSIQLLLNSNEESHEVII